MARRTKQDAEATRRRILDCAEREFERRGVAATSLDAIARAAGVTRGAIYWHFDDKADLFDTLMARARLPLDDIGVARVPTDRPATLAQLREDLLEALRRTAGDAQTRRVYAIAIRQVEDSGAPSALHARRLRTRDAGVADLERQLRRAARRGELPGLRAPRAAALGLHALLDGLLQNWMLDPGGFDLVRVGRRALDAYLAGLALPAP